VYLGKLTALREGLQSYVIFIVRDDRPADILFQCSDLTWQAYNRWPNQFALYDNGKEQWWCGPLRRTASLLLPLFLQRQTQHASQRLKVTFIIAVRNVGKWWTLIKGIHHVE